MNKDMQTILNKAKIGIFSQRNSVFITTVLFSLKQTFTNAVPTAATNGINLYINPDWFASLEEKERIGLLAHEAWHVAFQHMFRLMGRDPEIWNQAADHVINLMLLDNGFELPPNGLHDPAYKGLSTEQVYDCLVKDPSSQKPDPDMMDIQLPSENNGEDGDGSGQGLSAEELQDKVTDILVKAQIQSKRGGDKPGTIPGDIEIALDKLLNPKLPWHVLLANYVTSLAKEDYSFRRPNRRFMPDFYLPSLYSEKVGHIAVAVDTSGSVSDEEFLGFITEINHIKQTMNPELITVVDFDHEIKKVHKLKEDQDVTSLKFTGRGGTALEPVFELFEKEKPMVLIVFSDLYCRAIEENPGYPVVWVCVNNSKGKVNFGKLIHMEI